MPSSTDRIAVCPMPSSRSGCAAQILGDPAVVGLEARVLVVEVGVVAEQHADRRVDHLGAHAVAVLVGRGAPRDPTRRGAAPSNRAPNIVSSSAGLPAAATRPIGIGLSMPSMTNRSPRFGSWTMRGARSRKRAVDAVDVGAGRLGDVRVGGDDRLRHDTPSSEGAHALSEPPQLQVAPAEPALEHALDLFLRNADARTRRPVDGFLARSSSGGRTSTLPCGSKPVKLAQGAGARRQRSTGGPPPCLDSRRGQEELWAAARAWEAPVRGGAGRPAPRGCGAPSRAAFGSRAPISSTVSPGRASRATQSTTAS